MFLMPGMVIALYTCGALDKVGWGCACCTRLTSISNNRRASRIIKLQLISASDCSWVLVTS